MEDRAISLNAVLDALEMSYLKSEIDDLTYQRIKELPPVKSQEKTGHWIEEKTYMECPNCHDIWHYEKNQTERFKFCPTCGEMMK